MSDSVRPHRQQPTRLRRPWDSPGKNTGVGCHFLLQCMKVKSESEVTQSCLTLRDPMDCSLPSSPAHGIFQARVLEWVAIAFSEYLHTCFYIIGLPLWLSGKESACNAGNVVQSLHREDPLKEEMETHSSILSWTEKPGGLQPMGSQRVRHD